MEEIYDTTDIENKNEWIIIFTKEHPEETFTHEWVNKRLLFMDAEKAKDFRWYYGGFVFEIKDGIMRMLMGSSIDTDQREKVEKEHLKEGEFFKATYQEDKVTFDSAPLSNYKIVKAEPITPEKRQWFKQRLYSEIETKMKEIETLQKWLLDF